MKMLVLSSQLRI